MTRKTSDNPLYARYTREEEQKVFKIYQELKDKLKMIPITTQNQELIKEINTELKRIREDIFIHNLGLVKVIANRYATDKTMFDDFFQEGSIGMLTAIEKYDLSFERTFSTYAGYWISASIYRFKKKSQSIINISIPVLQRIQKYQRIVDENIMIYGKEPSDQEIIEKLRISASQLDQLRKTMITFKSLSFDYNVKNNDDRCSYSLKDILTSDEEDPYIKKETKLLIKEILKEANLTSFDKKIILLRMGFNKNNEPLTLEEIGERYSVTKQAINQHETKALKNIKKYCRKKNITVDDFRRGK